MWVSAVETDLMSKGGGSEITWHDFNVSPASALHATGEGVAATADENHTKTKYVWTTEENAARF